MERFNRTWLVLVWPRIDLHVSKLSHMIKAPWSPHGKTGRINLPLSFANIYDFNPALCPDVMTLASCDSRAAEAKKILDATTSDEIMFQNPAMLGKALLCEEDIPPEDEPFPMDEDDLESLIPPKIDKHAFVSIMFDRVFDVEIYGVKDAIFMEFKVRWMVPKNSSPCGVKWRPTGWSRAQCETMRVREAKGRSFVDCMMQNVKAARAHFANYEQDPQPITLPAAWKDGDVAIQRATQHFPKLRQIHGALQWQSRFVAGSGSYSSLMLELTQLDDDAVRTHIQAMRSGHNYRRIVLCRGEEQVESEEEEMPAAALAATGNNQGADMAS